MTEPVGGVMTALKAASAVLKASCAAASAEEVDRHCNAAAQCDQAIAELEKMVQTATAPAPRVAVETWAAQVEGLRFGFEQGVAAARYMVTKEMGDEWEGPIPPGDVEALIALFRTWIASRRA